MSINDIYYISAILIGSSGLAYTIINNWSPFIKHKIIVNIFNEISYLSELNKIELNEFIYLFVYIFGLIVLLYLHSIQSINIIYDLYYILELSMFIVIFLGFSKLLNIRKLKRKKSKREKLKRKTLKHKFKIYKIVNIFFHIYILILIYIIFLSVEALPSIAFVSVYSFLYFGQLYIIIMALSVYLFLIIEFFIFFYVRQKKFDALNDFLDKKVPQKIQISIVLKSGAKLTGCLGTLSIYSLRLLDFENTVYELKYKQIEIIGAKLIEIAETNLGIN